MLTVEQSKARRKERRKSSRDLARQAYLETMRALDLINIRVTKKRGPVSSYARLLTASNRQLGALLGVLRRLNGKSIADLACPECGCKKEFKVETETVQHIHRILNQRKKQTDSNRERQEIQDKLAAKKPSNGSLADVFDVPPIVVTKERASAARQYLKENSGIDFDNFNDRFLKEFEKKS